MGDRIACPIAGCPSTETFTRVSSLNRHAKRFHESAVASAVGPTRTSRPKATTARADAMQAPILTPSPRRRASAQLTSSPHYPASPLGREIGGELDMLGQPNHPVSPSWSGPPQVSQHSSPAISGLGLQLEHSLQLNVNGPSLVRKFCCPVGVGTVTYARLNRRIRTKPAGPCSEGNRSHLLPFPYHALSPQLQIVLIRPHKPSPLGRQPLVSLESVLPTRRLAMVELLRRMGC